MQTAELVAGRELDARVAERVIGRFIQRIDWEGGYFDRDTVVQLNDDGDTWSIVPYYSTDISAALQVVAALTERGFAFRFSVWNDADGIKNEAEFLSPHGTGMHAHGTIVVGKDAPDVICRAALAAVNDGI